MNGLNDRHRLRLRVTFEYVDELLSQILRDLEPGAAESLFNTLIADIKPVQRKVMGDYVFRLRAFMHDLLDHYESSLSSARLLSDLERIITAHALLELHPMLEAILERLESPALEIIENDVAGLASNDLETLRKDGESLRQTSG